MQKSAIQKPLIVTLFGLPGSGKTFFARQAGELLGISVVSSDRIRYELFESPTFSKEENQIVTNIMMIMLEELVKNELSAIFDISLNRAIDRKIMREFAKRHGLSHVLIWIQADAETCLARAKNRDRRKADDKYATEMNKELFSLVESSMQNPINEDVLVISGKHLFSSQKSVLLRKLYELQVVNGDTLANSGVAKPQLVNLVTFAKMQAGRVDPNRRNLVIN